MNMRAKMVVSAIEPTMTDPKDRTKIIQERVHFSAVFGTDPYGPNGESEDNTYARFTPAGVCKLTITNPDLIGTHEVGQKFYVDFTPADVLVVEEPETEEPEEGVVDLSGYSTAELVEYLKAEFNVDADLSSTKTQLQAQILAEQAKA